MWSRSARNAFRKSGWRAVTMDVELGCARVFVDGWKLLPGRGRRGPSMSPRMPALSSRVYDPIWSDQCRTGHSAGRTRRRAASPRTAWPATGATTTRRSTPPPPAIRWSARPDAPRRAARALIEKRPAICPGSHGHCPDHGQPQRSGTLFAAGSRLLIPAESQCRGSGPVTPPRGRFRRPSGGLRLVRATAFAKLRRSHGLVRRNSFRH